MSNPLVDLWTNELTGMTVSMVRTMAVYDEDLAWLLAEEGVLRGADQEAVLKVLSRQTEAGLTRPGPYLPGT